MLSLTDRCLIFSLNSQFPTILSKGTLLGETNRLASVYESIIAYEKGNWAKFSETVAQLRLGEGAVPAIYEESVEWANQLSAIA